MEEKTYKRRSQSAFSRTLPRACARSLSLSLSLFLSVFLPAHALLHSLLFESWIYSPWNYLARILEWVDFPFSRGSSQPRDQTQVSHIAGGFFTSWATREAWICSYASVILLLIPSSVLFISVCLFFSSFRSLVNVFCIFSVLFLKSWIFFTNIILNSFSGRLHISTCSRWWNRRMCAHLLLGDHQNCN